MKFFRFYFLDLACRQTGLKLSRKANGFSLMELMVAVGILAVISMMVFAKYPELNQRLAIKRTSEEIALIARQAQAYSLGIKKSASAGDNYYGFGIRFDKNTSESKTLILFTDSNGDKTYDDGELFQKFKIDTGDWISFLQKCNSSDKCKGVVTLDIVYPRASSVAAIDNDSNMSYAKVTIKSPGGNLEKNINIWISGQISVE